MAFTNYRDLDSDNDGIPDVVEAFGDDGNNNGIIDFYFDSDGDGFSNDRTVIAIMMARLKIRSVH